MDEAALFAPSRHGTKVGSDSVASEGKREKGGGGNGETCSDDDDATAREGLEFGLRPKSAVAYRQEGMTCAIASRR